MSCSSPTSSSTADTSPPSNSSPAASASPSANSSISNGVLAGEVRGLSKSKRQELLASQIVSIAVRGQDGKIQVLKDGVPRKLVEHFAPRLRNYCTRTPTHGEIILFDHTLRNLPASRLEKVAVAHVVDSMVDHVRHGTPHVVTLTHQVRPTIHAFYALSVFGMPRVADRFRAKIGWLLRRKHGSRYMSKDAFRRYLESLEALCDPRDALLEEGHEYLKWGKA